MSRTQIMAGLLLAATVLCHAATREVWDMAGGRLLLLHSEGAPQTELRLLGPAGEPRAAWSFPRVINLELASGGGHAAWHDGEQVRLLELQTAELHFLPGSTLFALGAQGALACVLLEEAGPRLVTRDVDLALPFPPLDLLWEQDHCWLLGRESLLLMRDDGLQEQPWPGGSGLRLEAGDSGPLLVTRRQEGQELQLWRHRLAPGDLQPVDVVPLPARPARSEPRPRTTIPYPLEAQTDGRHPVGNSYGELQEYGGAPYLHPGVDFLGDPEEEVRAVQDGVVKAVLTTGGNLYWRVAVGNSAAADSTTGYLYAHLNQNSITVAPGDSVLAGELLGTLVDWPIASFTHLHFARIAAAGTVWDGTWWTLDDPLQDMTELVDDTPPVFEAFAPGEWLAFRTAPGLYQDPQALSGPLEVVAHVHDLCNSGWRLDGSRLEWELWTADQQELVLSGQALPRDLPLDVYGPGSVSTALLELMYVRDAVYWSTGNYDEREYYSILTSDNGDGVLGPEDVGLRLHSQLLPDGPYLLLVDATDSRGNSSQVLQPLRVANGNTIQDLQIVVQGSSVLLAWSPRELAADYLVERRLDGGPWHPLGSSTQASWLDPDALGLGRSACYRVRWRP